MSENLKKRVGRLIAGSVHAMIDGIEQHIPEAIMEQIIREADEVIQEVRHELGLASANRHLAQKQHTKLNQSHVQLSDQISLALQQNREDLVRAAISNQLDIEAQLPVLENVLADLAQQEKELEGFIIALQAKQREMSEALHIFKQSRAQINANANAPFASLSPAQQKMNSASQAFDRVYAQQTGLTLGQNKINLEQSSKLHELEQLSREHTITQRLALLKANTP